MERAIDEFEEGRLPMELKLLEPRSLSLPAPSVLSSFPNSMDHL
jgi:hypothetical protein